MVNLFILLIIMKLINYIIIITIKIFIFATIINKQANLENLKMVSIKVFIIKMKINLKYYFL